MGKKGGVPSQKSNQCQANVLMSTKIHIFF